MKKQVLIIHGGDTFASYDDYISSLKTKEVDLEKLQYKGWKETICEELGKDYQVITPHMPSKQNAKYFEWKIKIEKFIPYLHDNVILVGHSLGGIFLIKYLSENTFPKKIQAVFLIAAPYDDDASNYSLADFVLPKNLEQFKQQSGKIFLYYSKDDPVVNFGDFEKYVKSLPSATQRIFTDKGHFNQEEFPELVEDIKKSLFPLDKGVKKILH